MKYYLLEHAKSFAFESFWDYNLQIDTPKYYTLGHKKTFLFHSKWFKNKIQKDKNSTEIIVCIK